MPTRRAPATGVDSGHYVAPPLSDAGDAQAVVVTGGIGRCQPPAYRRGATFNTVHGAIKFGQKRRAEHGSCRSNFREYPVTTLNNSGMAPAGRGVARTSCRALVFLMRYALSAIREVECRRRRQAGDAHDQYLPDIVIHKRRIIAVLKQTIVALLPVSIAGVPASCQSTMRTRFGRDHSEFIAVGKSYDVDFGDRSFGSIQVGKGNVFYGRRTEERRTWRFPSRDRQRGLHDLLVRAGLANTLCIVDDFRNGVAYTNIFLPTEGTEQRHARGTQIGLSVWRRRRTQSPISARSNSISNPSDGPAPPFKPSTSTFSSAPPMLERRRPVDDLGIRSANIRASDRRDCAYYAAPPSTSVPAQP